MKNLVIFILCFLAFASSATAQEITVKLKAGKVMINEQHAFDYSYFNNRKELYLYKIGTNQDMVILQKIDKHVAEESENFFFIYFSDSKKSLQTKEYIKFPFQYILKKLVAEHAISQMGTVNDEPMEKFINQYDEHLTNWLIPNENVNGYN